jgi:hypothetical protein
LVYILNNIRILGGKAEKVLWDGSRMRCNRKLRDAQGYTDDNKYTVYPNNADHSIMSFWNIYIEHGRMSLYLWMVNL